MTDDAELKKAGLKVTLPRLRILELLESSESPHLSAEDIYRQLINVGEEVGLATVYRVLTQFEQVGICIRHNFEEGHGVYELTPTHHHDHMVCVKGGQIFEFVESEIEQQPHKAASKVGFVIQDHSLYLYGVCTGMQDNGHCSMKNKAT